MSWVSWSLTVRTDSPILLAMKPSDFREVIGLWPSIQQLADELGENPWTVEKWRTRNRVPDRAWQRLVVAAKARRYPVTADLLMNLAADSAA